MGGRTSIFLFRLAVDVAAGRVPVIASSHVSDAVHDQADQLRAMAESGIDVLVLVTNRLDVTNAGAAAFVDTLTRLMEALPPELPRELAIFLALAAMAEPMGYPGLAKEYHVRLGTFSCAHSRVTDYDIHERDWAVGALLDRIIEGTEHFRQRISSTA